MNKGIRDLVSSVAIFLFSITLLDALFHLKTLIKPGISEVYNLLGVKIAPNMVTLIVFDWRGYDTLGEALILVVAVVIVLLIFGRGIVDNNEDENNPKEGE